MEESREESMIFDVYFPATVHAANTARELIVSRDMKKVPTRLVGNVSVRWSITRDLQRSSRAASEDCEYSGDVLNKQSENKKHAT